MTLTGLHQIRSDRCPHNLAFMDKDSLVVCDKHSGKATAIGCPYCGYTLPDSGKITTLRAPVAEITETTAQELLSSEVNLSD